MNVLGFTGLSRLDTLRRWWAGDEASARDVAARGRRSSGRSGVGVVRTGSAPAAAGGPIRVEAGVRRRPPTHRSRTPAARRGPRPRRIRLHQLVECRRRRARCGHGVPRRPRWTPDPRRGCCSSARCRHNSRAAGGHRGIAGTWVAFRSVLNAYHNLRPRPNGVTLHDDGSVDRRMAETSNRTMAPATISTRTGTRVRPRPPSRRPSRSSSSCTSPTATSPPTTSASLVSPSRPPTWHSTREWGSCGDDHRSGGRGGEPHQECRPADARRRRRLCAEQRTEPALG